MTKITPPYVTAAQSVFFAALRALPKDQQNTAAEAAPWVNRLSELEAAADWAHQNPAYSAEVVWGWMREQAKDKGERWMDAPEATRAAWRMAVDCLRAMRPADPPPPPPERPKNAPHAERIGRSPGLSERII